MHSFSLRSKWERARVPVALTALQRNVVLEYGVPASELIYVVRCLLLVSFLFQKCINAQCV